MLLLLSNKTNCSEYAQQLMTEIGNTNYVFIYNKLSQTTA